MGIVQGKRKKGAARTLKTVNWKGLRRKGRTCERSRLRHGRQTKRNGASMKRRSRGAGARPYNRGRGLFRKKRVGKAWREDGGRREEPSEQHDPEAAEETTRKDERKGGEFGHWGNEDRK